MENNSLSVIKSRRAFIEAFERNKDVDFILLELEPYRNRKQEIRKQTETLMKICLVDLGYIPLYLQYIFRRVLLEFKCGDFSKLYFMMKYQDGTLVDIWGERSGDLQNTLINKTKTSILRGVNSTLAAKGLQSVTIATFGTKFVETAFGEIINIKLILESAAIGMGIGLPSLYTVISAGSILSLTRVLSFTCTTTANVKYALVTFVEMLEYLNPPEIMKEFRLDIFLDLLREELVKHSIFDKDYLNYLLCDFRCYKDFAEFSRMCIVPDYQNTVPFCMLMMQDFNNGDISKFVFELLAEFCEMKGINFEKAVKRFDRLNKNTKSETLNSQRTLAERKRTQTIKAVIEVDPYV